MAWQIALIVGIVLALLVVDDDSLVVLVGGVGDGDGGGGGGDKEEKQLLIVSNGEQYPVSGNSYDGDGERDNEELKVYRAKRREIERGGGRECQGGVGRSRKKTTQKKTKQKIRFSTHAATLPLTLMKLNF